MATLRSLINILKINMEPPCTEKPTGKYMNISHNLNVSHIAILTTFLYQLQVYYQSIHAQLNGIAKLFRLF